MESLLYLVGIWGLMLLILSNGFAHLPWLGMFFVSYVDNNVQVHVPQMVAALE